mgnify:CR=1 FL=1
MGLDPSQIKLKHTLTDIEVRISFTAQQMLQFIEEAFGFSTDGYKGVKLKHIVEGEEGIKEEEIKEFLLVVEWGKEETETEEG